MFWALTLAIAGIVVAATVYALLRTRDVFHPLVYLGPMLLFLYCFMPLRAAAEGVLSYYLRDQFLEMAQIVHLLGIAGLVLGVLVGSAGERVPIRQPGLIPPRVRTAALATSGVAVASFAYGLSSVGGFSEAYGRAYGGGWADSGYLRELWLVALPAAVCLISPSVGVSRLGRYVIPLATVSPVAIHGLLGARRGPTFMVIVGMAMAWYFTRGKRPRVVAVLGGGVVLGALMLLLVTNRERIYLGSEWVLDEDPRGYLSTSTGNEFVYSAGLIADAWLRDVYTWGRRYATVLLVRPIPRALWPGKYDDASRFFGIPSMEENLGFNYQEMRHTVGWAAAVGAAPGVIADMWVEFWWLGVVALFAIGFLFGRVWRKSSRSGGVWTTLYVAMAALSIYLIMQTLEAFLFRFLIMAAATMLIWRPWRFRTTPMGRMKVPWAHQHDAAPN